jgi:putative PEP-CTERM system TPR-repeat lipoprotein
MLKWNLALFVCPCVIRELTVSLFNQSNLQSTNLILMKKNIFSLKQILLVVATGFMFSTSMVMGANFNLFDQKQNSFGTTDQSPLPNNNLESTPSLLESFQQSAIKQTNASYTELINLINQSKFEEAQKKLSGLIKETPNEPELYNLQAALDSLTNKNAEAIKSFEKSLTLDKNNINAHLGLARIYMEMLQLDKATDFLNKALAIDEKVIKTYLLLADIANHNKDYKQVESILLTGLEKSKGKITAEIQAYDGLEKFYLLQKQPEKILQVSQDIVSRHPEDTSALSIQVRAQLSNGQKEQAEQTLRKIVQMDRKVVSHRFLLAKLLSEQPDNENEVLKLFDEVTEIAPDQPQPLVYKGAYLIKLKKYKEALEVADKLEKEFPKLALGQLIQGDVYFADDKHDKALEFYQKVYQKMPYDKLLFSMTDIMLELNKASEAIRLLSEELKKNNKNIAIHYKLATLFEGQKDNKNAELHYRSLLDLQPENPLALNNLAWLYYQDNNPQAMELAKKAYSIKPEASAIADTYGYILIKNGKYQEGLEILKKAVALAPKTLNYQVHLAEAYAGIGDKDKAKEILQALLESKQKFSEKEVAANLLNKLR